MSGHEPIPPDADHLERAIGRLPRRRLAPESRRRILDGMSPAMGPAPLWRAPVPAWAAFAGGVAACLATVVLTLEMTRPDSGPDPGTGTAAPASDGPVVHLDHALLARRPADHQPRITNWTTITIDPIDPIDLKEPVE